MPSPTTSRQYHCGGHGCTGHDNPPPEAVRKQRFEVAADVESDMANGLIALLAHVVDGAVVSGTYDGRPCAIVCLVPPPDLAQQIMAEARQQGVDVGPNEVRGVTLVAILFDPGRDASHLKVAGAQTVLQNGKVITDHDGPHEPSTGMYL